MRVLRDRDAGLYLAGVVVSGFGTSALWLASGVWVKELTGSDGSAALCLLAMWAPTLVGPLLGTLADRVRRKPLLIGANLLLAALLLTLFTVDSPSRVWLLYAVLFVYGAVGVVQDAAEAALVAAAVDRSLLGDFNGLRMTATEGMKLVAPLAGAGLFAAYGGPSVALLDAVTFVLATGVYALLHVPEEKPEPPLSGWWARTAEGTRHLWAHARLRPWSWRAAPRCSARASAGRCSTPSSTASGTPRLRRCPVRRPGRRLGRGRTGLGPGPASPGRAPVRGGRDRPHGGRGGGTGGPGRPGGAAVQRGERRRAALRADRRDDGRAARDAGCAAGPYGRHGQHPDVHAERAGAGRGAALVELADYRPVLVALGVVLLVPAAALLRSPASAERTASRSPSDANPA